MNKIIGYVIAAIGIIGLAAAMIPEVGSILSIPSEIQGVSLTIISIIIAAVGLFFVVKAGGGGRRGKVREVPIFEGKELVGYRRTKR